MPHFLQAVFVLLHLSSGGFYPGLLSLIPSFSLLHSEPDSASGFQKGTDGFQRPCLLGRGLAVPDLSLGNNLAPIRVMHFITVSA